MTPEFSRGVAADTIGNEPRMLTIEADEAERAALARRFGLATIDRLAASLTVRRAGADIAVAGTIEASVVQSCVATGAPVPASLTEPFAILFRAAPAAPADEEVELGEAEMDVVFYDGAAIDLGEAVAETLALGLDSYPRAPDADAMLQAAGIKSEEDAAPRGALAGLGDLFRK